jgi:hypothetical protein
MRKACRRFLTKRTHQTPENFLGTAGSDHVTTVAAIKGLNPKISILVAYPPNP